jgi:hypothetical protein
MLDDASDVNRSPEAGSDDRRPIAALLLLHEH